MSCALRQQSGKGEWRQEGGALSSSLRTFWFFTNSLDRAWCAWIQKINWYGKRRVSYEQKAVNRHWAVRSCLYQEMKAIPRHAANVTYDVLLFIPRTFTRTCITRKTKSKRKNIYPAKIHLVFLAQNKNVSSLKKNRRISKSRAGSKSHDTM